MINLNFTESNNRSFLYCYLKGFSTFVKVYTVKLETIFTGDSWKLGMRIEI